MYFGALLKIALASFLIVTATAMDANPSRQQDRPISKAEYDRRMKKLTGARMHRNAHYLDTLVDWWYGTPVGQNAHTAATNTARGAIVNDNKLQVAGEQSHVKQNPDKVGHR